MEKSMTKEDALKIYLEKTARFNIFKVLGMQKGSENRHSNIIAWLLNPNESHNLKTQFLYKFLKSLSINADQYNLDDVSITREDSNEFGRPDIIIENDEFMCLVEVKFGAKETNSQCKRYYNYYKNLDKDKYLIFLDIDDECFDKLKKQKGYINDDIDKFNFSENYRLATFKNNILYILKELTSNIHNTDNNLVGVLNQYINLLNEKYYLLNENETRLCLDILKVKDNFKKYILPAQTKDDILHNTLHNFIWHTVPDKYNELLVKILKELDLHILYKWKENGSSLSFRCSKYDSTLDYHDNEHLYLDHRNNKIILNFQNNINQAEKGSVEIVSENEYFKNVLLSEADLFEKLRNKINQSIIFCE